LLSKIFLSDTLFYALKKFDMKNIDLFYSHWHLIVTDLYWHHKNSFKRSKWVVQWTLCKLVWLLVSCYLGNSLKREKQLSDSVYKRNSLLIISYLNSRNSLLIISYLRQKETVYS
jgi:hypothetical protein